MGTLATTEAGAPAPSLSEFERSHDLDLRRDARFAHLGMLHDRRLSLLTPFFDLDFLDTLDEHPTVVAVLTMPDLASRIPERFGLAVTDNPMGALYALHATLLARDDFYAPRGRSEIAESARIHPRAHVDELGVVVGPDCVVEPGAILLAGARLEIGAVIRAGAVIASEGFQVHRDRRGRLVPISHAGGARIGRGAEVQTNSEVARSLFGGYTEIGEGTRIDKLVHIGHNVSVGAHCVINVGTTISGSTRIGDRVHIGPRCAISNGLYIGDEARITIGSVVTLDVPPGAHMTGNFAIPHGRFLDHLRKIR